MKRIEISLQSTFADTQKDMDALQKMESEFKNQLLEELKRNPEAEIEAIFNFAGKNRMSGQWLSELDDYSRRTRCRQAGIETHEENPNMSDEKFQRYVDFRRQFMAKIEMGDNENQRRLVLMKRNGNSDPDDGSPSVTIDPRVLKADYGV